MLFHVIWTPAHVWSPADARGDWHELALTYSELTQRRDRAPIAMSHPLDRRWQGVREAGAVELSPHARTLVDQTIRDLAQNDRVAGDTEIRALAVLPHAVQVVLACPPHALQQRVGRLKSRTATILAFDAESGTGGKGTWSRGFWWARLEDLRSEAIATYVNGLS